MAGASLLLGVSLCPSFAFASAGCTVLLYYSPSTCGNGGTDAVTNVIPVLQAAGASVVTIGVCSATYDPTPDNWSNYSQVWDMRFVPTNSFACSGTSPSPVFSDDFNSNWQTVATAYLNSGGSIMLNGENAAFFSRSTDNVNFLKAIGAVSNTMDGCVFNTALSNGYATLGTPIASTLPGAAQFEGFAVGGIPPALIGTGTSYVSAPAGQWNDGIARDIVVGWSGAAQMTGLTGGSTGKLITVWDTTMWSGGYYPTYPTVVNTFFSSVYTWLGGQPSCGPTSTPTNSPTVTATPTQTNTPTATPTFTMTATNTVTNTVTATATNTATNTVTNTATNTPTDTPVNSFTPTNTATLTSTNTPANTSTPSNTPTVTNTSTPTATATPNLYIWPNPFNPNTAVNGVLKAGYLGSGAVMTIYTISGEQVISSSQNSPDLVFQGGYMIWNGRNAHSLYVSTGVYYYVILNGTKMLLTGKLLVVTGK